MKEENKPPYAEEYETYMNEQFRILMGHASRCFLRCSNKLSELKNKEEEKYAFDDQDRPVEVDARKGSKANNGN